MLGLTRRDCILKVSGRRERASGRNTHGRALRQHPPAAARRSCTRPGACCPLTTVQSIVLWELSVGLGQCDWLSIAVDVVFGYGCTGSPERRASALTVGCRAIITSHVKSRSDKIVLIVSLARFIVIHCALRSGRWIVLSFKLTEKQLLRYTNSEHESGTESLNSH